jgi:hypothetical protein
VVVSTLQAPDDQVLGAVPLGDLGQAVGQSDALADRARVRLPHVGSVFRSEVGGTPYVPLGNDHGPVLAAPTAVAVAASPTGIEDQNDRRLRGLAAAQARPTQAAGSS